MLLVTDVLTPSQRKLCMSRNRGANTSPEVLLRRELWRRGLRYRLRGKLFGKPDIVFWSARVAVFVDGCFWHGCWEHAVQPRTNSEFWRKKIEKNRERDQKVTEVLKNDGWSVLRIWEHEIKSDLGACAERVAAVLRRK